MTDTTDAQEIKTHKVSIAGKLVRIDEIAEALKGLDLPTFMQAIRHIIISGEGDQLKLLIEGLEVQMTPSAFSPEKEDQLSILKAVAKEFPFPHWLNEMGISFTEATRKHFIAWWETFMLLAAEKGYIAGRIGTGSRKTKLWKATAGLAIQMQADPEAYGFLPALLINHPTEIERVLDILTEPGPFIEVLTGECLEDMRKCPEFLGAFCTIQRKGEVAQSPENAILSVALALQRG